MVNKYIFLLLRHSQSGVHGKISGDPWAWEHGEIILFYVYMLFL